MVTSERSNLLSERERAIKVQTKSNVFEMMGAQSEQRRLTRSIALNWLKLKTSKSSGIAFSRTTRHYREVWTIFQNSFIAAGTFEWCERRESKKTRKFDDELNRKKMTITMATFDQNEVFRSMQVDMGSKTPYTDATQVRFCYLSLLTGSFLGNRRAY